MNRSHLRLGAVASLVAGIAGLPAGHTLASFPWGQVPHFVASFPWGQVPHFVASFPWGSLPH